MFNPRMTPKERNLLKGAVRRVFSRSDLRKAVIELSRVEHVDPSRPRVKKWSACAQCCNNFPTYLMAVDHKDPIIPIETALADMNWDTVVDRVWCEKYNLQVLCEVCHSSKTKLENKLRREFKKRKEVEL